MRLTSSTSLAESARARSVAFECQIHDGNNVNLSEFEIAHLRRTFQCQLADDIEQRGGEFLAMALRRLNGREIAWASLTPTTKRGSDVRPHGTSQRQSNELPRKSHTYLHSAERLVQDAERVRRLIAASRLQCSRDDSVAATLRVKSAMQFALAAVPFYRDCWSQITSQIVDSQIDPYVLQLAPLVTRDNVSRRLPDMCSDDIAYRSLLKHRTSGTTGEPVVSVMDLYEWHRNLVSIALQLERLGLPLISDPNPPWGFVHVTSYINAAHTEIVTPLPGYPMWRKLNVPPDGSDAERRRALALLRDVLCTQRTVLNGMPTVLAIIGSLFKTGSWSLRPPLAVVTSGELLTEDLRCTIQDLFRAPVYNFYGVGEIGCVAFECRLHAGLHVDTERLVVEVIDQSSGAVTSDPGEIVISTLYNDSMPLFRYRTGDFGQLIYTPCECGDVRPRLQSLIGRTFSQYMELLRHSYATA